MSSTPPGIEADGDPSPERDRADEPAFEVFESTSRFLLARDDDGYGIWTVGTDEESPVRRFPPTDDGLDEAYAALARLTLDRRLRWVPRLIRNVVIGSALVWVVAGGLSVLLYGWSQVSSLQDPDSVGLFQLVTTIATIDAFAERLTLGGVAGLAVIWFEQRWRVARDRDTRP